jgi:proline racemase
MIKAAAQEQLPVVHPTQPEFRGVTIAQLWAPPSDSRNHARNAVTVSTRKLDWERPATWTGVIDRSPCGTGTCARMAALHAKGQLQLGEEFRHEGVLGGVFVGELLEETRVGLHAAVVPQISGRAWITGYADYVLADDDPFPEGFTVGDLWPGE